jgi:hypothetical protein
MSQDCPVKAGGEAIVVVKCPGVGTVDMLA